MTNFEKIKKMSVDELVESSILDCACCAYYKLCAELYTGDWRCKEGIKKWLESEVKGAWRE